MKKNEGVVAPMCHWKGPPQRRRQHSCMSC